MTPSITATAMVTPSGLGFRIQRRAGRGVHLIGDLVSSK